MISHVTRRDLRARKAMQARQALLLAQLERVRAPNWLPAGHVAVRACGHLPTRRCTAQSK